MTVFLVVYEHKHGSEFWTASEESLAEAIVESVMTKNFDAMNCGGEWTLKKAKGDWPGFSGGTEFFQICELPLIENMKDAKKAQA